MTMVLLNMYIFNTYVQKLFLCYTYVQKQLQVEMWKEDLG